MRGSLIAILACATAEAAEFPPTTLRLAALTPSGGSCVAFRETGGCSPDGPREPSGDQSCGATIPCHVGACPSGYCECAGGVKRNEVTCKVLSHSDFTCDKACAGVPPAPASNDTALVLSNGWTQVTVDLERPSIATIAADMLGGSNFSSGNVLAAPGIRLERENADGAVCASSDARAPASFAWTVLSNTTELVSVRLDGIADCAAAPLATESWTLSLARDSRALTFRAEGAVQPGAAVRLGRAAGAGVRAVRRVMPLRALSLYALFDRGVVQMMGAGADHAYLGSADALPRFYALGGGSSVDVRSVSRSGALNYSVLVSNRDGAASALQDVALGELGGGGTEVWGKGWASSPSTVVPAAGLKWAADTLLTPNDRNFPAGGLSTGPNLPERDLEALLTGIYGSSPGCLCTFDNEVKDGERVAQIATTIAGPGRGYSGNYNFFDPDNFISLSAMLYSGDPYLQKQAQAVLMRSGSLLKVTDDKFNGQLPHHFEGDQPHYTALSGATQTGPNTFWTKTALQYASASGDLDWLASYLPTLRNASDFCFDLIDKELNLLDAPGSLMIDVFIREHYTADSNAMMVGFLRQFAEAERAVGSADKAAALEAQAGRVKDAMNAKLWATAASGDDHFITQLNPDGTTRDFVDYDANLIALAHGVPDPVRAARVLQRIDAGRCSAAQGAGPQFVSEVYYGKSDTTSGNTGDSWCSMGRIAWFDAHARKLLGSADALAAFDANLKHLQDDLIRDTWMHERYGCDGKQQQNRTSNYFEYPSTVAMLLREVRYGINLGFQNVTIAPFGPDAFTYDVGNVFVQYGAAELIFGLPGSGDKGYRVEGLKAGTVYALSSAGCAEDATTGTSMPASATVGTDGALAFVAPVGCRVTATTPA